MLLDHPESGHPCEILTVAQAKMVKFSDQIWLRRRSSVVSRSYFGKLYATRNSYNRREQTAKAPRFRTILSPNSQPHILAVGIRFMKVILVILFTWAAWAVTAAPLQLASQTDASFAPSDSAGGDSVLPIVSPDGRFVLFASSANNLALTSNNMPYRAAKFTCLNSYLRDRTSNTTVLVSINVAGNGGADRDAMPLAVSTNGQFVLFESAADNLISHGTNSLGDVFVRDLINGTNVLVSINTNGACANGRSYNSVMTPDGRHVAFTSTATDLVPDVTNGIPNIYARDLRNGTTEWVSVGAMPAASYSISDSPTITPDGHFVAFYSSATNLISGMTLTGDVYVRDLVAGTTTWASIGARSLYQSVNGTTNAISGSPRISNDGNYVAFETIGIHAIVLRYNLSSGFTDLVNTNARWKSISVTYLQDLDMTPDGRFIALVGFTTVNGNRDTAIFRWDGATGSNTPVSVNISNAFPDDSTCDEPMISSNGYYVAFSSYFAGLATNAIGNGPFLYLRDVVAGTTSLVNAGTNAISSGESSLLDYSLSADGQWVAFESIQPDLVTNDDNNDFDIFLHDTTTGTTELVSARQPILPSVTADGPSTISTHPLSQDGHFLVFASDADDLAPGDTNQSRDVFVRDLFAGTNSLVSVGIGGILGNANSSEPAISGNGRYIAFTSAATNLVAGDNNNSTGVFVRDLQAQTTTLVSKAANASMGNSNSYSPTISSDGSFVLFLSQASNLAAGTYTGIDNLFLRDLQTKITYALTTAGQTHFSMTPDGRFIAFTDAAVSSVGKVYLWDTQRAARTATNAVGKPGSPIAAVSISPDGNRIACLSGTKTVTLLVRDQAANQIYSINSGSPAIHPGLRFSADGQFLAYAMASTNGISQVYLYDFQATTNILASHDASSLATLGDGPSDLPDISADGRFVAYHSSADNLVADDNNNAADVFLYDAMTGANAILSAGSLGNATAANGSFYPSFSSDGHTLVFASSGTDLIAGDFNQFDDLFAFAFLYAAATATNGGNPTINWPAATGQTYEVEYKNDLTDPNWYSLPGTVTINGYRAFLTDATTTTGNRFYRVVSHN